MAIRLKKGPKVVLAGFVVIGTIFGLKAAMQKGLIPTPGIAKSIVASRVSLPPQQDAQVANVKSVAYPSTALASVNATHLTFDIWEWNAYFALIYANGGANTTVGSLNEKYGVNLTLHREDSNTQMKADLLACAKQLHDGEKACSTGADAIVVMGDGSAPWLADLNPQLRKLGPEYQVEIIGAVGRSNGEDALLGPAEWKSNPQSMKGKTVVGVPMDGDWAIALNFEGGNALKNNPDFRTYDEDAVNWIPAPDEDYVKAVTEVYVPNRCEPRKVVKDGHPTGDTKQVCPDGVVTWTPGDQLAVDGRPGTTKVVSSHEFASQMAAVIIGIKKVFNDNRDEVSGLLAAEFQAADQVKAFDAVRKRAGDISAKIYNDQNGAYWTKYYSGFVDPRSGQPLGGSAVFNMEDNLSYFGLAGGRNNTMRSVYEQFSKIDMENYPQHFKDTPLQPYSTAVDTSFIFSAQSLLNSNDVQSAAAESVDYGRQAQSGVVVGKRALYINFASNSDQPLPDSLQTLNDLKDSLAINSGLAIQLDGYTDNSGNDSVNVPLSQRRALAVKRYLQMKAPQSFPNSRFKSVEGHGSQDPIASNATESGRALNRRVQIVQLGD